MALSWRALSHMGASQNLDAKFAEVHAGLPRRHRNQAVTGHAWRRVDLEECPAAVGPEDQIEAAPAGAANDAKRRHRLRLDRALDVGIDAARTEVLGLVGKI